MNNVALITGASSGIGKELAQIHAAKGGDLVVVARSIDKLHTLQSDLQAKYGTTVKVIQKDLTNEAATQEVYDEVHQSGITIDYLINNAGFGGVGKFHEREWSKDLSMIQLNIIALTALTRLFLPDMVSRNQGKILNVSSTASLLPGPMQAVYYATKAYVTSFSNAIAEELHDKNISVTALLPGATETEFGQVSGMDKTDLFANTSSAREVAQAGYDAMLSGDLNVLAGLTIPQKIMMKMLPIVPKKALLSQIRKAQTVN